MILKNVIILCLIVVFLVPIMNAYALTGDAELVLENVNIDPMYPKMGDPIVITADVYNAGLKNTSLFTSIITAAYFVDGQLIHIHEIDNVEPGLSNKIKISSLPILNTGLESSDIKVILDYHNTLNDKYDSPINNIVEKTFFIGSLKSTNISLDVSSTYVVQGEKMPKIIISLMESGTSESLANKKIIVNLDNDHLDLITNKDGQISISSTITSLGAINIEAYFEGDTEYSSSSSSSSIYSFTKDVTSSLVVKILDSQNQYNFEDYAFDVLIFQDSYDTLIKQIQPDSTTLLDSKTFLIPLPPNHDYFAEIYLDGRLFFVIDRDLLKENSLLVKELEIPERAAIKFEITDSEHLPVIEASIKSWIYSTLVKNGSTDWIDVLPTNYGEPYVVDVFLPDHGNFQSEPFLVFSGERKTIPIIIGETPLKFEIPSWIKNNAKWWAAGQIDDSSFIEGIQFLIKDDIIMIPPTIQGPSSSLSEIPSWIKNNAKWWAAGQIDDSSFIEGIQFLIKEGIMNIS